MDKLHPMLSANEKARGVKHISTQFTQFLILLPLAHNCSYFKYSKADNVMLS